MQRSLWNRTVAALIAPWFAIVMAEPAALHTCSVHSGTVAAAATAPVTASHSHAAHQHTAVTTSGEERAPTAPQHSGNHCTCLGGCCAPAPVSIDTPSVLSWVPADVQRERPLAATDEIRAASYDYFLPFANGPPSRV